MAKKTKISRIHHYVPQFHLQGFLDEKNNDFFVFDKYLGKIRRTNTKDVLFEKDRNTLISKNGEKTDELEKMYASMESIVFQLFKKVQTNKEKTKFTYEDKLSLSIYLMNLYWRLPSSQQALENIIKKSGLTITPFILRKKDETPVDAEELKEILSNEQFKKAYALLLSFNQFYDKKHRDRIINWQFLSNDPGYFMIGDNPVICKDDVLENGTINEFIMPLSKECLLINNFAIPSERMQKDFFIQMALVIFHQSERFVCCHNELFLKTMIKYYKQYVELGDTDRIKADLFKMIDESAN